MSKLPLPIKRAVAEVLTHPLIGRGLGRFFHDRIPSRGFVFDTSSHAVQPRTKAQLYFGIYESAEIRFAERYLLPDCDVVELGASLGVITCHVRRKVAEERKVVAVEANPRLVDPLRGNLALNRCDRNTVIANAAVHYEAAPGEPVALDLAADTAVGRVASDADNAVVEVEGTTLEHLIERHGISEYQLVSDIEGAEAGILANDHAGLQRCRRWIAEFHSGKYLDKPFDPESLCETASRAHGFELVDSYGPVVVLDRRD
ncbi:MAG: FkbM family methyltransferase [Myxococcota bacterium]